MLAAILESGDLERLYTGLSMLVSAAAEGREARGLASFGALDALLAPSLRERALQPGALPHVHGDAEREAIATTLEELRNAAAELPDCRIWACAAAVQAAGVEWSAVSERLEGVLSTPHFLRDADAAGAQLVVV